MLAFEATPPPLDSTADGVIRIVGTRVSLETVVTAFDAGATAEEIMQQYPSLHLADIYGVISYVLVHRTVVDEYLRTRRVAMQTLHEAIERRSPTNGIRARLLARRSSETKG